MTDNLKDYFLAFVGCGHMGEAVLKGLLAAGACGKGRLAVYDPARSEAISAQYGVHRLTSLAGLKAAEIVLVAVKPQTMAGLMGPLSEAIPRGALVISVAAGLSLAYWEKHLAPSTPVVRTMPNMPALIGRGFTVLCRGSQVSGRQMEAAQAIFALVGETVEAEESAIHALTALSGCGPAYVFYFLEALAEAGIMLGLSSELAHRAALATLAGSAALAQADGEQPGGGRGLAGLRHLVTSPGGVTARALFHMDQKAVKGAVMAALEEAALKSRFLAESQ